MSAFNLLRKRKTFLMNKRTILCLMLALAIPIIAFAGYWGISIPRDFYLQQGTVQRPYFQWGANSTVYGRGTRFNRDVRAGDWIGTHGSFNNDGTNPTWIQMRVVSVQDDTHLTIEDYAGSRLYPFKFARFWIWYGS